MMNTTFRSFWVTVALSSGLLGGANGALAADIQVTLSGAQEVPAVKTAATGSGTISVGDDNSVKGSVRTTGVVVTMAHTHAAAPRNNGPVVTPLMPAAAEPLPAPAGPQLHAA